jgi:FkbM family methyltransferase
MLKFLKAYKPQTFSFLSFDQAMSLSKRLMKSQGFGAGASSKTSGENGVFKIITQQSPVLAPVLFDVGGHIGDYTDAFLQAHPGGRAYVFEPSASHFDILQNRMTGRTDVTLNKCALGRARAELPLYKDSDVSGLASLTQRRLDHIGIAMAKVEQVQVKTLDDVCDELGVTHIDLLKIDVEGHEMDVLRGSVRMFAANRIDCVQFEFGGCNLDTKTSLQDFFYFFEPFGFNISIVQPSGHIQPLGRYDEFFEHYRTTNYLARRQRKI